jgi:hypothetical protein
MRRHYNHKKRGLFLTESFAGRKEKNLSQADRFIIHCVSDCCGFIKSNPVTTRPPERSRAGR